MGRWLALEASFEQFGGALVGHGLEVFDLTGIKWAAGLLPETGEKGL
ncbi:MULTISPECIES: hypothetical protein [Rhizobium]|nr:hypothetical protein [Rhizobium leguminosarum]